MSFSNNKSTKWIIGILAVMNIALLSFILMAPGRSVKPEKKEGNKAERYSKFLQKELKLSDEERLVIKDLQTAHFKVKKEKYKKIKALKKEMFTALNLETPDSEKAKNIANKIGDEYESIEEMMINHYLALKSKCTTPEQLEKLEQIFERIMTRNSSHRRNHNSSKKGCR